MNSFKKYAIDNLSQFTVLTSGWAVLLTVLIFDYNNIIISRCVISAIVLILLTSIWIARYFRLVR